MSVSFRSLCLRRFDEGGNDMLSLSAQPENVFMRLHAGLWVSIAVVIAVSQLDAAGDDPSQESPVRVDLRVSPWVKAGDRLRVESFVSMNNVAYGMMQEGQEEVLNEERIQVRLLGELHIERTDPEADDADAMFKVGRIEKRRPDARWIPIAPEGSEIIVRMRDGTVSVYPVGFSADPPDLRLIHRSIQDAQMFRLVSKVHPSGFPEHPMTIGEMHQPSQLRPSMLPRDCVRDRRSTCQTC